MKKGKFSVIFGQNPSYFLLDNPAFPNGFK